MNHYKRNNGALIGALGLVVALTTTAAIGLVLVGQDSAGRAPSMTPQRSDVCVSCSSAPQQPAAMADEPELMRTDRANEHHG